MPPKGRIEQAALDLFARQGYRGTSVRELTLAVGLTAGALYNHFPSKEDLLYAIIRGANEELTQRLERALVESDEPPEQLWRLAEALGLYSTEDRRGAKVANTQYWELPADKRKDIIERRRQNRQLFESVLARGVEQGVFRIPMADGVNDLKHAATAVVNMVIRLSELDGPEPKIGHNVLARFHADLAVQMVSAS